MPLSLPSAPALAALAGGQVKDISCVCEVAGGFPLLFPCFAEKIPLLADLIPLLGRVENFRTRPRNINNLAEGITRPTGRIFAISLLFPAEQRN